MIVALRHVRECAIEDRFGAFFQRRHERQTVAAKESSIQLKQDSGALKMLSAGANLADVVKALNALGATPADLISILQSMKAAGALRADLEII